MNMVYFISHGNIEESEDNLFEIKVFIIGTINELLIRNKTLNNM